MRVNNELYIPQLKSAGLTINEEDGTVYFPATPPVPIMIDHKPTVIATRERLKTGNFHGVVPFHPLSENIIRGESPVLRKLRTILTLRLTTVISILMCTMTEIAADVDYHKNLHGRSNLFLDTLKSADSKTLAAVTKIVDAASVNGDYRIVRIYFKRGGVWKNEKRARVATVSFPIVEAAMDDTKEIFGVKLRVADKAQIQALLKFLLPNSDNPMEHYSYGSNSKTAPYYDALMRSYLLIAKALNTHIDDLRPHLDDADSLYIDTSWEPLMEQLDKLALEIPPLTGNEGEVGLDEKHQAEVSSYVPDQGDVNLKRQERLAAALDAPVGTVGPSVVPTPVTQPQPGSPGVPGAPSVGTQPMSRGPAPTHHSTPPVATQTGGGLKWSDVVAQQPRPAPVASVPVYQPTGVPNSYGAPQHPAYGYGGGQPRPGVPAAGGYGAPSYGYGQPAYPPTTRVVAGYAQ